MSSPVEQIKSRLNIVEVVQTYTKLQKAGVNFKAVCPFHSEKTPSFFVSPARDSWHCFGCGKGGDIFSFVMEIESVEFPEALKILAGRAGVELKPIDREHQSERLRLLKLMEEAKKFYEGELKKNKEVIEYLKARGLKGETAKSFGIGFAANEWRGLCAFLKSKKYSDIEIERSGMAVKSDKGYYDRFRNRIMFPIANGSGQIVGFSGRIFGPETETSGGKYINSPQTILYDKSSVLFGFDKAKNEIRKKDSCILVEGQMDVIMSHQAGITNTVAVSGTSLTNEHLRIIKRLTDNLAIAFDKDEAGRGAAGRGIDSALAQGFEVKVALIPSGKDPADAIKENPEEWKEALKNSKNIIEFYLDFLKSGKEIEKIVLPYVAIMPSEMEKARWVNEIAKHLRIKEEAVWLELKKIKINKIKEEEKNLPKEKFSRLKFLGERLGGFILWQKNCGDKELKELIDKIVDEEKVELENNDKAVFEAELFYSGAECLKGELEKLVQEFKKEKIKSELLEITQKIRICETNGEKKGELEKCLNNFYNLSKKLNELK
jgi:DNA primase